MRFCFLCFCLLALAPIHALDNPKTILILGDSIAAGFGLEPEQAFPALLQDKIDAAGLNWKVINGGVSGDTTAGGLRRIDWLLKQKIDVLLIELAGNDGLRGITPAETRKNLFGIVEKAKSKYPDVRVIISGMQMPPNMGEEYTKEYSAVFPAVAKQANAALIPFLLENVGGHPELNQADRIHPTPEGHKIVAENVWTILRGVLQSHSSGDTAHK
jgi:acyl-CoA thioesterase-1